MNDIPAIPSMRPEPERNQWGQYVLPDAQGRKRGWMRATTLAKAISDETALTKWKQRMVLQGLTRRPDLLDLVAPIEAELEHPDPDERRAAKEALTALSEDAIDAGGGNKGNRIGTALHSAAEYHDAGRRAEIDHLLTAEMVADLDAYIRAMNAAAIERPVEWIERICVNEVVDTAGTVDRIVRVPGEPLPIIADLKTAQSLDYSWMEIGIQLAEYAYAKWMWDETLAKLVPMPEVNQDVALVFHLPAGQARCRLYEVDLHAGWAAARLAHEVKLTRKESRIMARPWQPRPVGLTDQPAPEDQTRYLLRNATRVEELHGIWRGHVKRGLPWTTELNQAAAERKAELLRDTAAPEAEPLGSSAA